MYNEKPKSFLKHLDFFIIDLICLTLAFVFGYWVRFGFYSPFAPASYRTLYIVAMILDIVISTLFHSYQGILYRRFYQEVFSVVRLVVLVMLFVFAFMFVTQSSVAHSRLMVGYMAVFFAVLSFATRSAWKLILKKTRMMHGPRLLIIASADTIESEALAAASGKYFAYTLAGLVDIDSGHPDKEIKGIPIVANANSVTDFLKQGGVDEVIINIPDSMFEKSGLYRDIRDMGIPMHITIASATGKKSGCLIENIADHTVLTTGMNYMTPGQQFAKRALDIVGGVIGCIITGIAFLIFALPICIKSPGPVFFSQVRVGRNGRKFKLYKFRSMYPDAEERKKALMEQNKVKDGLMFKMDEDPRIIGSRFENGVYKKGIGNFIRSASIDELPQFFNVLKGDMSLVGTRPPTVDEWKQYELHHVSRLSIRPGITGLWQISGRSEITDFEEVVRLDREYINNWSFGKDILILLKTLGVVIKGRGAE